MELSDILPTCRGGASLSSTTTCTVSTSYPRVSHGSYFYFMLMLISYPHAVCLQKHLFLCYDELTTRASSFSDQQIFVAVF